MAARFVSSLVALTLMAAVAAAQGGSVNPACSDAAFVGPGLEGGNPCQKAYDMFGYSTQQYANVIAAGNPEIGRADGVGGFPKFRVALELNYSTLVTPALRESGSIATGPAVSTTIPTLSADYIAVQVNGALGLFNGFDLGAVRIGALDAIANINFVPSTTGGGFTVSADHKAYIGYGGRLGVLQEGKVIPAVGVSYIIRDLPKMTLIADDVLNNTVAVSQMKMNTSAWSVTVGKHFKAVSLVLGGGQTKFDASGLLMWSVNGINPTVSPSISATSMQTDFFGDFGVDLGSNVHVMVEYGASSGGQINTFNTFDPSANSTHSFLSAAITFGQ